MVIDILSVDSNISILVLSMEEPDEVSPYTRYNNVLESKHGLYLVVPCFF